MAIDKEIKNLSFIITVNDNCEIEIGKEYTDLLDLKPGDEFDIKLGRKNISLLRPGSKMFVWADDKENDTESNLIKEVNSDYKLENNYENKEYKSSYNYSYNNYSDYKKEEKKRDMEWFIVTGFTAFAITSFVTLLVGINSNTGIILTCCFFFMLVDFLQDYLKD